MIDAKNHLVTIIYSPAYEDIKGATMYGDDKTYSHAPTMLFNHYDFKFNKRKFEKYIKFNCLDRGGCKKIKKFKEKLIPLFF